MARVTSNGQTRASKTSPLMLQTSHLRDICQTGCDIMSVLVSQEADVLLANLAYGHDTLPLHAEQSFWHSRIFIKKEKTRKKLGTFERLKVIT
jgi:hypothetical protein